MKKILPVLLLSPFFSSAQFHDNFDDGDFIFNPEWKGDTAKFEVNAQGQLHLNAPAISETAYLYSTLPMISNGVWEFYVNLDFNPSSNNFASIYLLSDSSNFNLALNGYFIKIGDTDDDISFYKQTGLVIEKIIDGKDDRVNSAEATVRIKVTRDTLGNWELFSDTLGGFDYFLEGIASDNEHAKSNFFGLYCQYTSTRSNKFFFDDFSVTGEFYIDSVPPFIDSINVLTESTLELIFSEPIERLSAENLTNYYVDLSGQPDTSCFDYTNTPDEIILSFNSGFPNGKTCTLLVNNIKDGSGNIMLPDTIPFYYYLPQAYDITINEIMADPSPTTNLPEEEYIEIYNTSNYPINLSNWVLETGSHSNIFPNNTIKTGEYVILCNQNGYDVFKAFGNVVCFYGFPALLNEGANITLKRNDGIIISSVTYSKDWYQNDYKAEGGWSLECIDSYNPCGGKANWKSSESIHGGTPGKENSVRGHNPDIVPPKLNRAAVVNDSTILLIFNEPLDSLSAIKPGLYSADNNIGSPCSIKLIPPLYESVQLTFLKKFELNYIYTVTVVHSITDCSGNTMEKNDHALFAIPSLPSKEDIVINEILFNPEPGCVDFVEIYNRSEKTIDIKNILIGYIDEILKKPKSLTPFSSSSFLLFPCNYLAITSNPEVITDFYYTPNPEGFIELQDMPSFSDDKGSVIITDHGLNIIDQFRYNEDMHFPLLSNKEGVSLERINFDRPASDISNWHSAAESVGYATPGYVNSQFSDLPVTNETVMVVPEIFSPDNDGFNDVVTIKITLENPGWIANIIIFNSNGIIIKEVANNQLLAVENNFSWDGIDAYGQKSPMGIYIIYIETFDIKGHTNKHKKTCVLGAKL